MSLPAESRDALFKGFGRAFFKRDVEALYETVTSDFQWLTLDDAGNKRVITGREAVDTQLQKRSSELENIRFEDVIYHHAPDATFMTFRITATNKATGAPHEDIGVERYTFKDGRIAVKDVYKKPNL